MKQCFFLITFCFSITFSTFGQSCKDLQDKFYSYNEAIDKIRNATFKLSDKLPYGKSSWINSANYYSCDGYSGYLIYTTDKGKEYIHEKVPLSIWTNFKNANSSGSYYISNIKGNYRLVP